MMESLQAFLNSQRGGTRSPRAGGDSGNLGLSFSHISPQQRSGSICDLKINNFKGGGIIEIRKLIKDDSFNGGGVRGKITSFSESSRFRLIKYLSKLDSSQHLPIFVTLTYPMEYSLSYQDWKKNLDTFAKRFKRKFENGAFIWKLEPQKRGAPHYHLILFPAKKINDISKFRRWLSNAWFEVVNSGDSKHLGAGVQADYVESWKKVRRYTSKYLGKKVSQGDTIWKNGVGRFWGVRARQNLKMALPVEYTVTKNEAYYLLDMFKKFKRSNYRKMADNILLIPEWEKNKDLVKKYKYYRKQQKKAFVSVQDTIIVDYGDFFYNRWESIKNMIINNSIFEKRLVSNGCN